MTKLLEQAFTTVSTRLSHEGQDRLAQLMIRNLDGLEEILKDAVDDHVFDASAVEAFESDKVQHLLRRVVAKHSSTKRATTNPG